MEGSPATGQDSNLEKPKTLKDYLDRLNSEIDRLEKLSVKESDSPHNATLDLLQTTRFEAERLKGLARPYFQETPDLEILGKPISEIIGMFEKSKSEYEEEYKNKFGGRNLDDLQGEEKQEAERLIAISDDLDKAISRMIQFES